MRRSIPTRAAALFLLLAVAGCGAWGENDSPNGVRETLASDLPVPGPAGPLEVSLAAPVDGSLNVPVDAVVRLTFSRVPASLDGIALLGPDGETPVSATVAGLGAQATVVPDEPLVPGGVYRVVAAAGMATVDGAILDRSRVWEFTAARGIGEPVVVAVPPHGGGSAWSAGVWVDPSGATADIDLEPPAGTGTEAWTIDRPTTLYTVPAPLTPHRIHWLGVTATSRGGGATAALDLPFAIGWTDVTPAGLSALLHDVEVLSPTWAVAAGDGGTLLATRDGGLTWQTIATGTGADLHALHFVTPRTGWAVGTTGTLLHTTDGTDWTPVRSGTRADLNDVTFVGALWGVAVGNNGVILVTRDGGDTWERASTPNRTSLNRVACGLPDTCHAVGDGGMILLSRDGGDTWETEPSGTGADLLGITYNDDGYRWIVGEGGIVLVGGGGSDGWVVRGATGQTALTHVAFADTFNGWAVGTGSFVIHTADGGFTWSAQMLPAGLRLEALAAHGNRRALAVGTDSVTGLPVILATDTGGVR